MSAQNPLAHGQGILMESREDGVLAYQIGQEWALYKVTDEIDEECRVAEWLGNEPMSKEALHDAASVHEGLRNPADFGWVFVCPAGPNEV